MKYLIMLMWLVLNAVLFMFTNDLKLKVASIAMGMSVAVLLSAHVLNKQRPVVLPKRSLLGGIGMILAGSLLSFCLPHPLLVEVSGRTFFFPIAFTLIGAGALFFLEAVLHYVEQS